MAASNRTRRNVLRALPGLGLGVGLIDRMGVSSAASLTRLVEKVGEGGLSMEHVVSLAPFLPREALDGTVDRMAAGEIDPEHLRELAPFLSREALARVLGMVADGKLDAHTIVELAPFLDKETLESLIRRKRA